MLTEHRYSTTTTMASVATSPTLGRILHHVGLLLNRENLLAMFWYYRRMLIASKAGIACVGRLLLSTLAHRMVSVAQKSPKQVRVEHGAEAEQRITFRWGALPYEGIPGTA